MKAWHRPGFSLLEVLLATGILLGSLIVLGHLTWVGRAHVQAAEDYAKAQRIGQTKLNEILAGLAPLTPVAQEPLEDEPGWVCSVEVEPLKQPGLLEVRVIVSQEEEGLRDRLPRQFTLVHWVRDPGRAGRLGKEPSSGTDSAFPRGPIRGRRR